MDKLALGSIEMAWDAERRIATLRFTRQTAATRRDADALIATLRGWIGSDRRPFALLGDGERLARVEAGYRAAWGEFFKEHREDAYLAFFNMGPIIRLAADMFRLGTGTKLKACRTEEEARAWLRGQGILA